MKALIAAMMLVSSVAMADHHEAKKDAPGTAPAVTEPAAGDQAAPADAAHAGHAKKEETKKKDKKKK